MPELPEVETTVRGIIPIIHRKIARIWSDWDKMLFLAEESGSPAVETPGQRASSPHVALKGATAQTYARLLTNREVVGVARRGKYIIIRISGGYAMVIHQKMTGHLLLGRWRLGKNAAPLSPRLYPQTFEKVNHFIHFVIEFRGGMMLALSDVRKFGCIIVGKESAVSRLAALRALGPDPLENKLTSRAFAARLRSKSPIKKILLNQSVIAGIGNIYSDEILFRAKIHPLTPGHRTTQKSARLLLVIRKTLAEGISRGGASKTNYRKPNGEKGGFMDACLVYGRAGLPCAECGMIIQKIKIGGRSASFCPKCQRLEP